MALSQDCQQQHHRERTLSQRWIAVGAIGATGLHLGLLPLVGFDADALVSRSEDEPIQIIVTSADTEAALSPEAALGASPLESLAAATPPAREWLEPEPPETLEELEEDLEPEALEEPELEEPPEPEAGMDEPEPEPEAAIAQDPEPEPEPEVAAEPEPESAATPAETPTDWADEAETAGAETVEGGGKPEQIAKQPVGGDVPTAPGGDAAPVVALAPAPEANDGGGNISSETTNSETTNSEPTELGGLLEGYFPEGAEGGLLDRAGEGDVARSTGPGDRGNGNATEDSRGEGEGRGNGSRTVRCRSCTRPSYPTAALADGIEGEAKVSVQFDANGNVIGVTLERSSGNPALDQAALASAEQWQFDTGGQSGSVAVEIPFVIEGSDRHRDAQRQGDRESATLPNRDPTATRGQSRDRAIAPSTESDASGASSESGRSGTANDSQDAASEDADAATETETTEATPSGASSGETASGETGETPQGSGDAEAPEPPMQGGTGDEAPAPVDPTPAAETAPAPTSAPATPATPPPATAEPPPVPAAPAAEE